MWERLFDRMMRGFVSVGRLDVTLANGQRRSYAGAPGPQVAMQFNTADLPRKLVLATDMAVGEGYMNGDLTLEGDDLRGFFAFLTMNVERSEHLWWRRSAYWARKSRRRFDQWNPAHRARENVAHHYDLSARLYDLFLDADRQYSCAYFTQPDLSLEDAQTAKKAHIANKLCLQPGMRVFEIGSGWGGLALSLARDYEVEVLGVTLSTEQHAWATERARAEGLSDRVRFELKDYRAVTGQFDRIVSVGMFEHVGVPHYRQYFDVVRDRLTDTGVALIHTIGRAAPPGTTSPWIAKYIFPGGYIPALSEMSHAFENAGLYQTDIEVWRLHYAETLKHWQDRFEAKSDQAATLYDDRFVRMWRFYLAASEMTFRHGRQCVFQVQLARAQDAVPLTRAYMEE
jgi:cyclopropane-fatty-acyl-phospholipid synthase